MIVFSQDRKSIFKGSNFMVQKNLGGGKDKKFIILGMGKIESSKVLAFYSEEKTAVDVLAKLFEAIESGDKTFILPEDV